MKKIGNRLNRNMKKLVVAICVILLLGSIIISGISFGNVNNSKPRGYVIPELIDLNVTTGAMHQNLTIYGPAKEAFSGQSVATGDVSGDGIDDILIAAPMANGPSNRIDCGAIYIIYGSTSLPDSSTRDLAVPAQYDVVIYGMDANDHAGDSIAAGDIDGDGIDDIIIGASSANGPSNARPGCGEVYVIFGSGSLPGTKDLLSSAPDVIIYGIDEYDLSGWQVTTGDVNLGNSIDDLIISALHGWGPSSYLRMMSGEVYILNGKSSWSATYDLNTTSPDVTIYGTDNMDRFGWAFAAGNIDGTVNDYLVIG